MAKEQRSRLLRLHSLGGIAVAFFLFIVCFSGTVSLFTHELTRWADGTARIALPETLPPVDTHVETFLAAQGPDKTFPLIVLTYPNEDTPYFDMMALAMGQSGPPSEVKARWSATDVADIGVRGENLPEWLALFHTDLWLPYPYGRSIIGVTGLLLLIIVVAGVFLHQKPVKASFQWRPKKNLMTLLFDSHSTLGLWGFLFHAVCAFTGAVLGLSTLLGGIFTLLAFAEGNHAELEPMPFPPFEAQGVAASTLSVDTASAIAHGASGVNPSILIITNYGRDDSVYRSYYEVEKNLVRFGLVDIQGTTGKILAQGDAPANEVARAYISILPLHTGTYGGIVLKIFYGILGASLCLMIITGVMMWLERGVALDGSKKDKRLLECVGRLAIGICAGFPLAVFGTLYTDQFITVAAGERPFAVGLSVFLLLGAAIIVSFLYKTQAQALRTLLCFLAVVFAGLPFLDFLMHGDTPSALFASGSHSVIVANGVFILLAVGTALIVRKLKSDQA